MTDTEDVNVEVRGEDIIITAFGTDHLVIYSRREDSVELRGQNCSGLWIFACELDLGKQKGRRTGGGQVACGGLNPRRA